MKVLHVNYYDQKGGAAKAAYRLHRGLIDQGIGSKMLVVEKTSDDDSVICAFDKKEVERLKKYQRLESLITIIEKFKHKFPRSLNLLSSGLPEIINELKPDIVNLHWINGGMLGIEEVAEINGRIIWTLHDGWCYCGAEHHHKIGDERFRHGYNKLNMDINRFIWNKKRKSWMNLDFSIVTPSSWLASEAQQSILLKDKDVLNIPNGVDLRIFTPSAKEAARQKLGISSNKKVIAFGAFDINDKNKGGRELFEALQVFKKNNADDVELLLIGKGNIDMTNADRGFSLHYTGLLLDDKALAVAYQAADVFILASKYDNLPNMLIEAIACGIPCVAFNIGGIADIIDHKQNGYLTAAFDCKDFASGIEWILGYPQYDKMSQNARKKAEEKFDIAKVSRQYLDIYKILT